MGILKKQAPARADLTRADVFALLDFQLWLRRHPEAFRVPARLFNPPSIDDDLRKHAERTAKRPAR